MTRKGLFYKRHRSSQSATKPEEVIEPTPDAGPPVHSSVSTAFVVVLVLFILILSIGLGVSYAQDNSGEGIGTDPNTLPPFVTSFFTRPETPASCGAPASLIASFADNGIAAMPPPTLLVLSYAIDANNLDMYVIGFLNAGPQWRVNLGKQNSTGAVLLNNANVLIATSPADGFQIYGSHADAGFLYIYGAAYSVAGDNYAQAYVCKLNTNVNPPVLVWENMYEPRNRAITDAPNDGFSFTGMSMSPDKRTIYFNGNRNDDIVTIYRIYSRTGNVDYCFGGGGYLSYTPGASFFEFYQGVVSIPTGGAYIVGKAIVSGESKVFAAEISDVGTFVRESYIEPLPVSSLPAGTAPPRGNGVSVSGVQWNREKTKLIIYGSFGGGSELYFTAMLGRLTVSGASIASDLSFGTSGFAEQTTGGPIVGFIGNEARLVVYPDNSLFRVALGEQPDPNTMLRSRFIKFTADGQPDTQFANGSNYIDFAPNDEPIAYMQQAQYSKGQIRLAGYYGTLPYADLRHVQIAICAGS